MRFNDPVFLFVYLPIVLAGYYLLSRARLHRPSIAWLLAASILFYIYDDARRLLPLIATSIAFNVIVGRRLVRTRSRAAVVVGVGGNLLLLGYFKYAQFLADSVAMAAGSSAPALAIALPIGISFYTFTQIAFLVDAYRGRAARYRLLDYALFVTIFPHLVAGPILRHDDTVPQLEQSGKQSVPMPGVVSGWAWFSFGFAKKVLLADSLAPYADGLFDAAARGDVVSAADAWGGTVAYALQLYFDFSGYSDMAIGLALMLGIRFPMNFDSPYKAASLADFWRRWHITLSTFLRDYLYIPLGGNRRGTARRYVNLLITMVLGGLWHGAAWTFVVWGALHGIGLVLNHAWVAMTRGASWRLPRAAGRSLTLLFVLCAWVPFRAESMDAAVHVWSAMFAGPAGVALPNLGVGALGWIALLAAIALAAPNTQQILGPVDGGAESPPRIWTPTLRWGVATGLLFGVAVSRTFSEPTTFLYFRF